MKTFNFLLIFLFVTSVSFAQPVYINEIKYTGTDKGVEIKGPFNTNLSGWSLIFYKGSSKKMYGKMSLSGTISGSLVVWFRVPELNDGHPKGAAIALVDNNSNLIEFLSYGDASFVAKDGIASGITSTNIGAVTDSNNNDLSIQRNDSGEFQSSDSTPGEQNNVGTETLSVKNNNIKGFSVYPNPVLTKRFKIASNSNLEKHVEIYSTVGKLVYNQSIQANEAVDVSNLNAGFYLVNVRENGKFATRKLIIN